MRRATVQEVLEVYPEHNVPSYRCECEACYNFHQAMEEIFKEGKLHA